MPNDFVPFLVALFPGFALILSGMVAFWSQREKTTGLVPLWRGIGIVFLSAGIMLEWNGLARQGIVSGFSAQGSVGERIKTSKRADAIQWVVSLEKGLEEARREEKIVLVDFYADWCAACVEMEKTTFRDKQVISFSQEIVMVKIDVDKNEQAEKILGEYQVKGLPTVIFLDSSGNELKRMVGYVGPVEMISAIKEVLKKDAL